METQLTKVLNNVTNNMQRLQGLGSLDEWHLDFQASMHEWNEKLVLYNSVFAAHAALSGSAKKVEPNAPTNFKAVLHDLDSMGAQIPPVIANTAKTLDLDRMIERGEHAKALRTLAKFTQEDCSKPLCTFLVEKLSASCSVLLRNHMGACSGNRLLEAEKALRERASFCGVGN